MRMKNAVLTSSLAASISTIFLASAPTACAGGYYMPDLQRAVNAPGLFSAAQSAFYGVALLAVHLLYMAKRGMAKKAAIRIGAR